MSKNLLGIPEFTLAEAMQSCERAWSTGQIPYITGKSGVGKTAAIEALAAKLGYGMIPVSLVTKESYDIAGIPDKLDNRCVFLDPTLIPLQGDTVGDVERVVVFIDEMPEGEESTLKAIYRVINERMINDKHIHEKVVFVCSGNRQEDGANTKDLMPTVCNRMFHISIKLCYKEWISWATSKGVAPIYRAWIAANPQFIHDYDMDKSAPAFSTPRSITNLAKYNGDRDLTDTSDLLTRSAPIQFLGPAAGMSLLSYAEAIDLPPIQDVLDQSYSFDTKTLKPGSILLLGQSLISIADEQNLEAVIRVLENMPAEHMAVNSVALCNDTNVFKFVGVPAFTSFMSKHKATIAIIC